MKLIDAFKLGFVLHRYRGLIVYGGLVTANEDLIEVRIHKGFEEGSKEAIKEIIHLPIATEVDTKIMDLALRVSFNEDLASSLRLVGVAPITTNDIRKTRFTNKE